MELLRVLCCIDLVGIEVKETLTNDTIWRKNIQFGALCGILDFTLFPKCEGLYNLPRSLLR